MIETEAGVGTQLTVRCGRDELASRLALVSRAVSSRGSVHVLGGVHVSGGDGEVELAATDMELSLRTSLPAACEGSGAFVVPGRLLVDLVKLLPSDEVTFTYRAEDGTVAVTSGSHASRVNIYSADDFPRLPSVDVPLHAVQGPALLDTIERVSRSASRDESRPVLTGILVRFEGTTLTMAATDSYRLSVKETALAESGPELEAIIPARALTELTRVAAGAETIQLGVHENHVVFGVDGVWLTTRRIDGQFPNVKQLLPESFEVELEMPREALLEVVRRAAVVAQRNTPLRLAFTPGELTVSAQSQDVGDTRETLPADFQGEPLEIGFNADFLREGLESIHADAVRVQLINPLRPGLLTADGDAFWYLIMPIRLSG